MLKRICELRSVKDYLETEIQPYQKERNGRNYTVNRIKPTDKYLSLKV